LLGVVILRVLVMLSMLSHFFGCRNTEYCSDAECLYVKCQFWELLRWVSQRSLLCRTSLCWVSWRPKRSQFVLYFSTKIVDLNVSNLHLIEVKVEKQVQNNFFKMRKFLWNFFCRDILKYTYFGDRNLSTPVGCS